MKISALPRRTNPVLRFTLLGAAKLLLLFFLLSLGMSSLAFRGSIELGFLYALVALGLFVSYRVLDIPDLTVDGSFTLGAAASAVCAAAGHPLAGVLLAVGAGICAGLVTAFLQTKLRIQPILAGILSMIALTSINLRVMGGKANIALLNVPTLYSLVGAAPYAKLLLSGGLLGVVCVLLSLFFRSQTGLCVRATGDNADMVRSSSINTDRMKFIGLGLANGLVGLAGGLLAQYQSFSDANMGVGTVVIGLASLIIGEVIFGKPNIPCNIVATVLGAMIYRLIYAFVLDRGMSASDMKLVSAVVVILAISYPVVLEAWTLHKLKKAARQGGRQSKEAADNA